MDRDEQCTISGNFKTLVPSWRNILGLIQVFLKTVPPIGRNKFASINKFQTQLQTLSQLEFFQVIEFQIIKHTPTTDFCL